MSGLLLAVLLIGACGDEVSSTHGCHEGMCELGFECVDSLCQRADCTIGSEGCACTEGGRCGRGGDGSALTCMDQICTSSTCPAGEQGCLCAAGVCNTASDSCQAGYCVDAECEPGTRDCSCVAEVCDEGLHCLDGALCVDNAGYPGGACLSGAMCHRSARCDTFEQRCIPCTLGSEGCGCDAGVCETLAAEALGSMGPLVCGPTELCTRLWTLPPEMPRCYTACDNSSDTHLCIPSSSPASGGLIEGCIDDLRCTEGSCLADGMTKDSCFTDVDCPYFQTCLSGGCYSNCSLDSECPAGNSCHNHVCRTACDPNATDGAGRACGEGFVCEVVTPGEDGVGGLGHCVSRPSEMPAEPEAVLAGFALDHESLELSNVRAQGEFELHLGGERGRTPTFSVRRLWHEITASDGTTTRVEAARDPVTGELAVCDAALGECPLVWLRLSAGDVDPDGASGGNRDPEIRFDARAACLTAREFSALEAPEAADRARLCTRIFVKGAEAVDATRWRGELEISGNGGLRRVHLDYTESAAGQWVGTMHYLGSFDTTGLDAWKLREDKSDVTGVSNALIRRWATFRQGRLGDGWPEMEAVLAATRSESWNSASMRERCSEPSGACYPYSNTIGFRPYVTNLRDSPIPSGVLELPVAINLQVGADGLSLSGRIETSGTLHYPGNPAASLRLSADPAGAASCDPRILADSGDCALWIDALSTTSVLGGRIVSDDGTCPAGFSLRREPWLVDGFVPEGAGEDVRLLCVDTELPTPGLEILNASLALANPIADGTSRRRTLHLLDGAMIDQNKIFVLFEEEITRDSDGVGESTFGYMTLGRQPAVLDLTDLDGDGPDIFEGNEAESRDRPRLQAGAACSPALMDDMIGVRSLAAMSTSDLRRFARILLEGTGAVSGGSVPDARVHYLCEDTGLFDGGAGDDGTSTTIRIPCPLGSRVEFFVTTAGSGITQRDIAAEACQLDVVCVSVVSEAPDTGEIDPAEPPLLCTGGTCHDRLIALRSAGRIDSYVPRHVCDDPRSAYCDADRADLRAGKTFYAPAVTLGRTFNALQPEIDDAFRYRTRFSSSRSRVGFAPSLCIEGSDAAPYCYDPGAIEESQDRIDCLLAIYSDATLHDQLGDAAAVNAFLRGNFSSFENGEYDGFERLYAELQVLLGDEALTNAYASRFDLAAVSGASFEGAAFETDGINLSGVAGFEMVSLHRAVQHYRLALERFHGLGPNFEETLRRSPTVDSPQVFLSAESVTALLERMTRASTQKARALSEIARRYVALGKVSLGRRVIERAYPAAYLEGVLLRGLMDRISERSARADRPQIEQIISQTQRRYRMALLDMRDLNASLDGAVNTFGFSPDYIPLPALDASARGQNEVEILIGELRRRVAFAASREAQALVSNRSFQTDTASFAAELARLRNSYEDRLVDLCGSFTSPFDGRVYPTTQKYASRHPWAQQLGSPCGRMGIGRIHTALVDYQSRLLGHEQAIVRMSNLDERVTLEEQRISDQCDQLTTIADFTYQQAGRTQNLQSRIHEIRTNLQAQNATIQNRADRLASILCVPPTLVIPLPPGVYVDTTACPNQALGVRVRGLAGHLTTAATFVSESIVGDKQERIQQIQRETAQWTTLQDCTRATVDSAARVATLLLSYEELELNTMRTELDAQVAASEIERLHNEAARLQDEQSESERLLIDVTAARNDPNVRVYRNDAIINADIAFQAALRSAYRATRAYELFTSTSYAGFEQLFVVRMVGSGEYNLENYLIDLQNAFDDFEMTAGGVADGLLLVSLLDDVLQIALSDNDGTALSTSDRSERLRARLRDVDLLDANGHVVMPFSIDLLSVEPTSANHRILRIEAEIIGTAGDHVGRLYLRPVGTGVVQNIDGTTSFYTFPRRQAVIETFFNGNRVSASEVYSNTLLRGYPLANTRWELVFNQRDEYDNRDIQLDTITDMRLYIYYAQNLREDL